jgi:hypothetical protein
MSITGHDLLDDGWTVQDVIECAKRVDILPNAECTGEAHAMLLINELLSFFDPEEVVLEDISPTHCFSLNQSGQGFRIMDAVYPDQSFLMTWEVYLSAQTWNEKITSTYDNTLCNFISWWPAQRQHC